MSSARAFSKPSSVERGRYAYGVRLSVAIMHTPGDRSANVRELVAALPGAFVVRARGQLGVWDTAARAWLAGYLGLADRDATHHLVLQDDVTLCSGFVDLAWEAVAQCPDAPLSLFCSVAGFTAQAVVLPIPMIHPWLTWCAANEHRLPQHDDVRLRAWMKTQGLAMSYVRPSLVQHGALPSLLGHEVIRTDSFEQSPARVEVYS